MKKRRSLLKGVVRLPFAIILFLISLGVSAQERTVTVSGVVRSDSGQVLSEVSVIAKNSEIDKEELKANKKAVIVRVCALFKSINENLMNR